jgi:hypothetical protein
LPPKIRKQYLIELTHSLRVFLQRESVGYHNNANARSTWNLHKIKEAVLTNMQTDSIDFKQLLLTIVGI